MSQRKNPKILASTIIFKAMAPSTANIQECRGPRIAKGAKTISKHERANYELVKICIHSPKVPPPKKELRHLQLIKSGPVLKARVRNMLENIFGTEQEKRDKREKERLKKALFRSKKKTRMITKALATVIISEQKICKHLHKDQVHKMHQVHHANEKENKEVSFSPDIKTSLFEATQKCWKV
jgi:hypothetical protein